MPRTNNNSGNGFEISYRSCVGATCSSGHYDSCKPQCARFVNPCCRHECEQLGLTDCPECVKTVGDCSASPFTFVSVTNVKITINNIDYCVPIVIDPETEEFERCDT